MRKGGVKAGINNPIPTNLPVHSPGCAPSERPFLGAEGHQKSGCRLLLLTHLGNGRWRKIPPALTRAVQSLKHDADLLLCRVSLVHRAADIFGDLLGRLPRCPGLVSHLHSLVVTMSQISSPIPSSQSVSNVLVSDMYRPRNSK